MHVVVAAGLVGLGPGHSPDHSAASAVSVGPVSASGLSVRESCLGHTRRADAGTAKVGVEVPGVTSEVDGGDCGEGGGSSWIPLRRADRMHITVVAMTTDAAADQASALRRLAAMAEGDQHKFILGIYCTMHQVHFVVQRQMKRAMGGKYVSKLQVLVNLWRSPPNPPRVRQAYEELFSADVARRVAHNPPPAAIRGRWGAVHESERHILRTSREELLAVCWPYLAGDALQ